MAKANRAARRAAANQPQAMAGALSYLQNEGVNDFSGYALIQNYYVFQPNTAFDDMLERILLGRLSFRGHLIQDFDATRLANLAARMADETRILVECRLDDLLSRVAPGLTPSNTAGHYPWERSARVGLEKALIGKMQVSGMAVALSAWLTRAIMIAGPVPSDGYDGVLFTPTRKSLTLTNLEGAMATMRGYDDGLQYAGPLGVYYSTIDPEDLSAPGAVSILSDHGQMVTYLSPFVEDNGGAETEYVHAFDDTMDLMFNQFFGVTGLYDLAAMFTSSGLSRAADKVEMLLAPSSITTGKCSLIAATRSDTSFTEIATNDALTSFLFNGAAASSLTWSEEGSTQQTVTDPLDSESAWDAKLEDFIADRIRMAPENWMSSYGIAPLPLTAREAAPEYENIGLGPQDGKVDTKVLGGRHISAISRGAPNNDPSRSHTPSGSAGYIHRSSGRDQVKRGFATEEGGIGI